MKLKTILNEIKINTLTDDEVFNQVINNCQYLSVIAHVDYFKDLLISNDISNDLKQIYKIYIERKLYEKIFVLYIQLYESEILNIEEVNEMKKYKHYILGSDEDGSHLVCHNFEGVEFN